MPSPPPPDDNDTSSLYHPVTSPSMRPIPTSTLKTHLTMTSPLSSQPRILKHMGKPFTPAVPNLTSKIIYIDHLLHTLTKTTTPSYHQDTPSTVNHTTTSYIHIPPDKLIPIILTNLPTYLTPTTTSLRVDPATTYSQYISPNESLLFFILPVRTAKRKTGVRRYVRKWKGGRLSGRWKSGTCERTKGSARRTEEADVRKRSHTRDRHT